MNLAWDKALPPVEIWAECYRVLKPGGFGVVFGYRNFYHRVACQLEDVGFRVKDCLCWGYASGMPHSYDISKAIDKFYGADRTVIGRRIHPTLKNNPKVKSRAYHVETLKSNETMEQWNITEPSTNDAKAWNGWGTELKSSWEPILVVQKPIEGTYVNNILKHKVGAMNIDECRIPYASEEDKKSLASFINFASSDHGDSRFFSANEGGNKQVNVHPSGRWPGNLLWLDPLFADYDHIFMVPKPSKSEKGTYNDHSTVKPIRLMERLINLFTPKPSIVKEDVIVIDPFMGSGTTGVACKKTGRKFVGFEIDEKSFEIAVKRIRERTSIDIGDI
jgi:site-specific DNA-methyltransferase (adenine-specific)